MAAGGQKKGLYSKIEYQTSGHHVQKWKIFSNGVHERVIEKETEMGSMGKKTYITDEEREKCRKVAEAFAALAASTTRRVRSWS